MCIAGACAVDGELEEALLVRWSEVGVRLFYINALRDSVDRSMRAVDFCGTGGVVVGYLFSIMGCISLTVQD